MKRLSDTDFKTGLLQFKVLRAPGPGGVVGVGMQPTSLPVTMLLKIEP